jgi:fatty-acyl-CoA synthase
MNADVIEQPAVNPRPRRKPSAAKSWLKAIELTSRIETSPRQLFADVVEGWAVRQPHRPALVSDVGTLSYGALADRINRYARWALFAGIGAGDTVCLLMPGRPDYVAAWLGISRVGGVVALINTKLVGASLAHCVNVAAADHIILGHELASAFAQARPHLKRVPKIWLHGNDFKQKKQDLIRAGFDPNRVTDPLFFRDPKSGAFLRNDAVSYAQITEGAIRL